MVLDNLSVDSGVSSIVINLFRYIRHITFDFLIFKETGKTYVGEVEEKGNKVYVLPNPLNLKKHFLAKKEINRFFKENASKYDVVHLHSPSLNEFVMKSAFRYGIKNRIIHSHSSMTSSNKFKAFINSYFSTSFRRFLIYD